MGLLQPTASSPWPVTRGSGPLCVCASVRLCVCTSVRVCLSLDQSRLAQLGAAEASFSLTRPAQPGPAGLWAERQTGRRLVPSHRLAAAGPCPSLRVDADTPAGTGTHPPLPFGAASARGGHGQPLLPQSPGRRPLTAGVRCCFSAPAAGPCPSLRVDADPPAMTGTRPTRDSATVVARVSTDSAAHVLLQRGPSGVNDQETTTPADPDRGAPSSPVDGA